MAWSFTSIKGDDPLPVSLPTATGAIVLAIPTLAVATVTSLTQRYLDRTQRIDAVNGAISSEANLNYLVGPYVHILVGKSDPSVETLIGMFKEIGVETITLG